MLIHFVYTTSNSVIVDGEATTLGVHTLGILCSPAVPSIGRAHGFECLRGVRGGVEFLGSGGGCFAREGGCLSRPDLAIGLGVRSCSSDENN